MNARTLCLSILFDCEATGYEIRKLSTEGEYSYFVDVSYGAIYPALAKLADEELISVRIEAQEGKPSKKIYSINETGRQEFLDTLLTPVTPDSFKSEFLLFAHFASEVPRALLIQRIEERIKEQRAELETINEIAEKRESAADFWIVGYGRTCIETGLHYLETNKEALIALAKEDDTSGEQANDGEQVLNTSAQPTVAAE